MDNDLAGEPKNENSEMKIKEKPTHRSEHALHRLVLNWFVQTAKTRRDSDPAAKTK
jgi:hypothetical protein